MLYKRAENWLFLRRLNYVHRAIILHWIPVFFKHHNFQKWYPTVNNSQNRCKYWKWR